MIHSEAFIKDTLVIAAAGAIDPHKRVVITGNAAVLADASAAGIGTAHTFSGGNQLVRPRQVGKTALFVTDEAVSAYAPLYAKAGGLVGALTAAEPLCCYALESVGVGGGTFTGMWV